MSDLTTPTAAKGTGKGWLVWRLALGLVLTLSLVGVWLYYVRRTRGASQKPASAMDSHQDDQSRGDWAGPFLRVSGVRQGPQGQSGVGRQEGQVPPVAARRYSCQRALRPPPGRRGNPRAGRCGAGLGCLALIVAALCFVWHYWPPPADAATLACECHARQRIYAGSGGSRLSYAGVLPQANRSAGPTATPC